MEKVINEKRLKNPLSKNVREKIFWAILVAPAVLVVTLFIIVPIIDSVIKSFTDYKIINIVKDIPPKWNNFKNYTDLLEQGVLGNSVLITFEFVLSTVILSFAIGMTLALILNSNIKGARFFRSIMMTPWVVPTVISALVWIWIYQPQYGLLRYFVEIITGGKVKEFGILNSTDTALIGITIAALWKQIPLMTLLLLAGLQNVPEDIMEAAKIDGANGATRLFKITIPYMMPVIKTSISMSIIDNFKQFPLFWQMTSGGPYNSTTTLAVLSYQKAFIERDFGAGAAVTTIWMIIMIFVVLLYNKIFKAEDVS